MYLRAEPCPFCSEHKTVLHWGTNRCGSKRYRCTACKKCFTHEPHSNRITAEKEQLIERALEERLSIEATARLLKVAKKTIYKVLKKRRAETCGGIAESG